MSLEEYINLKKENIIKLVKKDDKISLDKENVFEKLQTTEVCKKCKGYCCTFFPKVFSPSDFLDLNDFEYLKSILDTGLINVQLIDEMWVLRPRGKIITNSIISYNEYYNSCILYDSNIGCMLPVEFRPTGCLLFLIGKSKTKTPSCEKHINLYSKELYLKDYEKYQNTLKKIYLEYYEKQILIGDVNSERVNKLVRTIRREN